jgi:hypothetical protein
MAFACHAVARRALQRDQRGLKISRVGGPLP